MNGYRHIGNKRLTMDQSEKFSDYLFAKMGPPIIGNNDNECPRKTTDSCEAPVELTGFRKWFSENLMLMVTLSGVLFGIILGNHILTFLYFLLPLFMTLYCQFYLMSMSMQCLYVCGQDISYSFYLRIIRNHSLYTIHSLYAVKFHTKMYVGAL